jgi:hypothetical protein
MSNFIGIPMGCLLIGMYFRLSFRFGINDIYNSRFSDYLHLIYPIELEVKDTTDTQKSASS